MATSHRICPRIIFRNIVVLALIFVGIVTSPGAQLKEARVTEVVKDVKLLPTGSAPRLAAVSDEVGNGTAVRTGVESRSELKFPDQTLARLGANTVFSFSEGTRSLNLQDGAMLLRVPKGAGGAKISSSAITAAITGTTVMVETHPLTKQRKDSYYKFIVLEGTARLFLPGQVGESVLVKAGQMIIMPSGAKKIPEAADVDIQKIMQSSLLITGFGPLGSEQLIALEQTRQFQQKTSGQLHETNLMIAGGGTNVILGDPNQVDVAVTAQKTEGSGPFSTPTPIPSPPPTPTPSATPSKFGTPVPITSPDPYVITSGTAITTDPSITTNGVTGYGKVWRGPSVDGPLSAFIFGSTSAFDTASGFDTQFNSSGAGFKFNSLLLTGNPTISTTGGEVNLGLIAINGITSGAPGGMLTFAGIRGLLLATQNGPIILGPEISFSGLHDINFYARGANSILALACDISASNDIRLFGENAIQVTGNLTTENLSAIAGANISIGGNESTTISANEASLLVPNSGSGNIPGSATITLVQVGNLVLNSSNGLSLTIDNSNGGHIGQSAIISLSTGDLTAGSLNVLINDRNAGSIGSSAQVILQGGAINIQGNSSLGITTRNDGAGGGIIGGEAMVSVFANSISIGGELSDYVATNGGQISGTASLFYNVIGDIHSGADTAFAIQAVPLNNGGGALTPAIIGSDALLSVTAGNITSDGPILAYTSLYGGGQIDGNVIVILEGNNITTASSASGIPGTDTMALETAIYSNVNGKIGKDAVLAVVASQNISAPGETVFWIPNGNYQSLGPGSIGGNAEVDVSASNILTGHLLNQILNYGGASIGGNALISLDATSLSVNGDFDARIDNTAGTIGGDAAITINAAGLAATGAQFLQLLNSNSGRIGGSATIDVTTTNLSADQLFVAILNSVNDGSPTGTITSNAAINFNVSGTATVTTDATFQINGSDSAASSTINLSGGTYNVGGTFEGFMDGSGTMTFTNVTINADTVKTGIFGANGTLRIGGGSISANTLLHLYAPSIIGRGGIIDFVSDVTLSSSATAAVIAANTVTIENGIVVTIAPSTSANVYANVRNYSARSGGNGNTTGTFVGAVTTQPLGGQPPFNSPSARLAAKQSQLGRLGGGMNRTIHVTDSSQLGSLLENASPGRDGKVRIASAAVPRTASVGKAPAQAPRTFDRHRSVATNVGPKMLASRSP